MDVTIKVTVHDQHEDLVAAVLDLTLVGVVDDVPSPAAAAIEALTRAPKIARARLGHPIAAEAAPATDAGAVLDAVASAVAG